MRILNKITRTIKALWYANSYVTLDCNTNFIYFSRRLYVMMGADYRDDMRMLLFKTSDGRFGFCFASDIADFPQDKETCDLCDIGKKVGLYAKRPTVAAILYHYGLPHDMRCRLSVLPERIHNQNCYIIMPPYSPQHDNV